MKKENRFREIPYNYTSLSDKEIILKYFDDDTWEAVNELRTQRVTGRSAKHLYEILGDIFVIERNPYLFEDFLSNKNKLNQLKKIHNRRLEEVAQSSNGNALVDKLVIQTKNISNDFFKNFSKTRSLRNRILFSLTGITAHRNIHFTPFHKVSHATDATDWRVEYPFVIVYPDSINEIPKLIKTAKELDLVIIPRGGGTGLTGGAVPVKKNTLIINTEKLSKIDKIEHIIENGMEIPVINAEAGVVTDDIIEYCEKNELIFATDPTSSWASTIGGNIAENAGGKKCVMWGTAIDNVYSFALIDPNGELLLVKRKNHPYRKIMPDDLVNFDVIQKKGKKETYLRTITLKGTEIRKKGLGKDITNKTLNGLPGIQKEGGDGIIVSAQFVLYKPFKYCKTLCIEFFGTNMINASKAIVDITNLFPNNSEVFLTALEHFDEKYVSAINYRNKSNRNDIPKAVLLIDIESENENKLAEGCNLILDAVKNYNAEGKLALDDKERKIFWNDRKHLGAIAKHTNAFKLNEDIVIPLERLPEFADFIEQLNFEKEFSNSLSTIRALQDFLLELVKSIDSSLPRERINNFIKELTELKLKYEELSSSLQNERVESEKSNETDFPFLRTIQNRELKFGFDEDVVTPFGKVFYGYDEIQKEFEKIVKHERERKIIIATHMHAGDGNVHVNIPVHSSDYLMMLEADEAASLAMKTAVKLGGVVSGEHGIGLTKLKFVEKEILDNYQEYKKKYDPADFFNPGKLNSNFPLHTIYTPSFNLLECEAIILESTDLEQLTSAIATCVRCGKCKSVCNTHYPKGNMMYNPRNKILAVGLITEAILFSAQTLDMKSFIHFTKMREIADNCTVCHKCKIPCPVKIDFGDVSLTMRKQLVQRKKSSLKIFTSVALFYLGRKKYYINKILRALILNVGYSIQRIASTINKPVARYTVRIMPKIFQMLKTPFPKSGSKSVRETFKLVGQNSFYCFENKSKPVIKSVVYFPGCGSERMFPEISFATLALLYNSGVRVVIPHEYLCCGYPFLANGRTESAEIKSYENRVLFHRLADTASYMNIDAVIVSCGTCYEMIEKYEIENIFNGAALMDINEFIIREKLYGNKSINKKLLYHEPCHTPLKNYGFEKTFKELYNHEVVEIPNCCGEAGTMALSRPDISNTLRERKYINLTHHSRKSDSEILTTCPSCVLGLSKLSNGQKVNGKSLVVYNAEQFLGKDWKKQFTKTVKNTGVEKLLM